MRAARRHVGFGWPVAGLLGSLLASASATRLLAHRPMRWWWQLPVHGTHGLWSHLFWAGIVLLCVGWLGLGWRLHRRPGSSPLAVAIVGLLWALPLVLGPALLSLDMYSYLAQGAVLFHGLNPYHKAPLVLEHWHQGRLLGAISHRWRHTTAPYGPLFIGIAALIAAIVGPHATVGVTLLRVPELLGIGLVAVFAPRLASRLGADPARTVWLAALSPLTLLYLIGGGHNDALMVGLMVAGVALALERRPLAGIALCALAACVKLPAAAGVVMIGICWLHAEPQRWRAIVASSAAVVIAVLLVLGLATGVGVSWISGSLFSTPASARMALTPSTAISVTLWELTHHFGPGVQYTAASWERMATYSAFALVAVIAVLLCLRVRFETLTRYLGLLLLAAAVGGPAAWPWYLSWGLTLLGADLVAQRSPWLVVVLAAAAFPVMPGGQVAISLPDSWRILLLYGAAIALATVLRFRPTPPGSRPPLLHARARPSDKPRAVSPSEALRG